MLTILIVDDDPMAISLLRKMLAKRIEDVNICWSKDALATLQNKSYADADILFLDVEMPSLDGLKFYKLIKEKGFRGRTVFTTGYNEYMLAALREHAFDFLLKPIDESELDECLLRIKSDVETETIDFNQLSSYDLTAREIEIVKLIFEGLSSENIGSQLFISKNTVDTHRRNILSKTGCKNSAELISLLL